MHGIEVRNPSFLRRFTLKLSNTCYNAFLDISLSALLLQNARHTVLNHHFTYSYSGIGSIERALRLHTCATAQVTQVRSPLPEDVLYP